MLKIRMLVLCLVAAFVYAESLVDAEEGEMCIPMGNITLSAPESVEPNRTPVEFPHALHFEISCRECHHNWVGDDVIQSCSTSDCHNLEEAPKKGDGDEPIMYYKASYHKLCIGCHKGIKAENEEKAGRYQMSNIKIYPTGPTGCIKCHPKE